MGPISICVIDVHFLVNNFKDLGQNIFTHGKKQPRKCVEVSGILPCPPAWIACVCALSSNIHAPVCLFSGALFLASWHLECMSLFLSSNS